jgi:hypothetical protein
MRISDIINLPALRDAKTYFALFNVIVIFGPRWGLVLSMEEIASINLFIAIVFGVASPSAQWVQMRIAQRHLRQAQNVAQDYHGLKVGK